MIFIKSLKETYIFNKVRAIVIYPFCYHIKNFPKDKINHENIHERQVLEVMKVSLLLLLLAYSTGIIYSFLWLTLSYSYYLLYVLEYLMRLLQYKDKDLAYRNISFEREAYANQHNLDYLKTRTPFRWLKNF